MNSRYIDGYTLKEFEMFFAGGKDNVEKNVSVMLKNDRTKKKVAVQKALDETQLLFDSFMQDYCR